MLVVCLTAAPAAAQLYRWTDGEGTVHYTADLDTIPSAYRAAAELLSSPQPRPAPPRGPEPTELRVSPGADLDPVAAGNLCDQFERAASLLVGPGRARTLADTLRRAAADMYGS